VGQKASTGGGMNEERFGLLSPTLDGIKKKCNRQTPVSVQDEHEGAKCHWGGMERAEQNPERLKTDGLVCFSKVEYAGGINTGIN